MPSERAADNQATLSDKKQRKLAARYRVTSGDGFRLRDFAPDDAPPQYVNEADSVALLADGVRRLAGLQDKLYAHGKWSVLIVLQAMDAAGKDSTIKHVMSGVNPQGVHVTPFKQPGPEDLAHDFLWRVVRALPARGMIGIFNRSHYEEVLVCRVHPELLDHQQLPTQVRGKRFWEDRLDDIAAFERHLNRQGTLVLKFFLNVSRAEQKKRFLARLDEPGKNWKFSSADLAERAHWDEYMAAYEAAIAGTACEGAPWYVVPADRKWFTRLVVVEAIIDALETLDLSNPPLSAEEAKALAAARAALEAA